MTIQQIITVIENFAPLAIQEEWDNCGLIVGDLNQEVTGVLIGFDCTEALIDEAVEKGMNLVITHHPLIFKGIKKISPQDIVGKTLIKAIKHGIAIYAAHTNIDKVIGGVSGAMANKLELKNIKILDGDCVGLGVIGNLNHPMGAEDFILYVKQKLVLSTVKCSKPINKPIKTVALCGGSGSFLIDKAHNEGADVYITGDISYHNFFVKEDYMIMDIGHFESEINVVSVFFSLIKKNFSNFAVAISEKLNNPIYYY